jgi:hypothetical protein
MAAALDTLAQNPLAAGGPFTPPSRSSEAAGSDPSAPQQPAAQQESLGTPPKPEKIRVYRRRPLRRGYIRRDSFLWHVSRLAAKLSGMVVVSFSVLFIPHINLNTLRHVGTMLPDPNTDAVRAAESRVKHGLDSLAPPLDSISRPAFGMGSSKETVLAAQGRPTSTRGGVWRYGDSEVYFVADRVAGWHDSPNDPLMLR